MPWVCRFRTSFQGESLLGLMFGIDEADRSFAYTETYYPRLHYGWSELRALYHDDLKYILAPDEELYRVRHDTGGEQQSGIRSVL